MQVVYDVCQCMDVYVGVGGREGYMTRYKILMNFVLFLTFLVGYQFIPSAKNSRHSGNSKTTFKNQKASKNI